MNNWNVHERVPTKSAREILQIKLSFKKIKVIIRLDKFCHFTEDNTPFFSTILCNTVFSLKYYLIIFQLCLIAFQVLRTNIRFTLNKFKKDDVNETVIPNKSYYVFQELLQLNLLYTKIKKISLNKNNKTAIQEANEQYSTHK